LGGAALGDIGWHFPDTDPRYLNRSSLELLKEVRAKVKESGWVLLNIDATLLAQRPRLSPFIDAMRKNLADALDILLSAVSIKATTTEGMNAEGEGEGISAQAVALLERLP
jgi:2-C-methyl-D-erythritol 2,4-cyclodiphosphate synthase